MIEVRSLRDFLRLFFIFRREFRWAVFVTVLVAVLGAFLLPPKYQSNARLLVKPGLDNTTLPIEAANRQVLIAPRTQNDPIVDEEKILTGRPVVQQVAKYYLEHMDGQPPEGWWKKIKFQLKKAVNAAVNGLRGILQFLGLIEKQTPLDRLSKKFEKNFSVDHEPGSTVIDIRFVWDDPVVAREIVNYWIQTYTQERGRILGRHSLYSFYEAETNKTGERIAGLKQEIAEQLKNIGSFSTMERLENLTNEINRTTAERVETRNTLAGLRGNLETALEMLGKMPAEETSERLIALNPAREDLALKLNELYLERARLRRTYTEEAPPIVQINKNIGEMQAEIARLSLQIQHSENRAPNVLAAKLKEGIQEYRLEINQLEIRQKELDAYLADITAQRLDVISREPELSRLQRELAVAEQNYALYADSLEKSRIERELDNSRISNIAIVEQATLNPSRIFPKSLIILLLALPLGIAVGLLVIYLCYLLDQRIHDGGNIEKTFSIPLWATLQDVTESGPQQEILFNAAISRLYGMLPLQRIAENGLTVALTSSRPGEGVSFITTHLAKALTENGYSVRCDGQSARPGEISILEASDLLHDRRAFMSFRQADIILLVVEARKSTVPAIDNILSMFKTALLKVDGIIINRRHLEIPDRVIRWLGRVRG